MAEIVYTTRNMIFDMECPQCKNGRMRFTGMIAKNPDGDRFHHVCSMCGFQNVYEKTYPSQTILHESEKYNIDE